MTQGGREREGLSKKEASMSGLYPARLAAEGMVVSLCQSTTLFCTDISQ